MVLTIKSYIRDKGSLVFLKVLKNVIVIGLFYDPQV